MWQRVLAAALGVGKGGRSRPAGNTITRVAMASVEGAEVVSVNVSDREGATGSATETSTLHARPGPTRTATLTRSATKTN